MWTPIRRTIGFLAALTLLSADPTGAAAQDALHVESSTPIEIPDSRIVALSPDGRSLAVTDDGIDELCVYDVATLARGACASLSPLRSDLRVEDVRWSPDSSRLAFAEQAFREFRDGDLWVMETATGVLTNLTEDGYDGNLLGSDLPADAPPFSVDVSPAWSPDGSQIAFSRSSYVDGEPAGNQLVVLNLASGDVQTLVEVTDREPGVIYYGVVWSAGGETISYTVFHVDREDPANGVYVVPADGGTPTMVASWEPTLGAPAAAGITPDGSAVLISYPAAIAALRSGDAPSYYAVARGGDVIPILPVGTGAGSGVFVMLAVLSPDGATLLFAQRDLAAGVQLFAMPTLGGDAVALAGGALERVVPIGIGLQPVWSSAGRVFLNSGLEAGVLIELEGPGARSDAATPVTTPEASPAPGASRYVVNDADVPMRAAPSTDATIVMRLPQGAEVTAIGPAIEADGFVWLPVIDPSTQTIGYVRAEFLTESNDDAP
jgi:Tol biopolymer transport system component